MVRATTHRPSPVATFPLALSRGRLRGPALVREMSHTKTRRCRVRRRRGASLLRRAWLRQRYRKRLRRQRYVSCLRVKFFPARRLDQIPARSDDPSTLRVRPSGLCATNLPNRRVRFETCSTAGRVVPRAFAHRPSFAAAVLRSGLAACAAPGPGTLVSSARRSPERSVIPVLGATAWRWVNAAGQRVLARRA